MTWLENKLGLDCTQCVYQDDSDTGQFRVSLYQLVLQATAALVKVHYPLGHQHERDAGNQTGEPLSQFVHRFSSDLPSTKSGSSAGSNHCPGTRCPSSS